MLIKLLHIFILFHLGYAYAVLTKLDDDLPPAPCFEPDRVALLGFKAGIINDTTHVLDSWTGLNCCNWDGIVCDEKRSVIRLTLQGPYATNNIYMNGTLSSSLGDLRNLQALFIAGMKRITGPIPERLSNLVNLTLLVLDDNGLQGQIPSSLGKLHSLQVLSLMGNHLTGQIPPALGNARNLTQIALANNLLTGPIPSSFKNLIKLQLLELSHNALSSTIPDFSGDLDYLSLSNNQLSGAIPISLCKSIRLSVLQLDGNRLSGSIPTQIGQLKSLSFLSLAVNKLTGPIPVSITKLPMLWSLNLSRNALSNRLQPPLSFPSNSFPHLLEIDLSYNNLNLGTFPEWIKNKQLSKINLAGCKIRGTLPRFSGSILKSIDLSDNYFTDGISNLFVNMTSLETVKLSNNQIKSDLSTIKLPKELVSIDLHSNQLYGSLSSLLNDNTTTSYNFLETIDVSNNSISGQIPNSISKFLKLEKLDISRNKIGGTIPPAIGMLHGLKWLDISRNGIIGKIPDTMLKIEGLRHANFKVNKLCGLIPQGRPLNAFKANAYLHNLCLCGKPLPPCKGKQRMIN